MMSPPRGRHRGRCEGAIAAAFEHAFHARFMQDHDLLILQGTLVEAATSGSTYTNELHEKRGRWATFKRNEKSAASCSSYATLDMRHTSSTTTTAELLVLYYV